MSAVGTARRPGPAPDETRARRVNPRRLQRPAPDRFRRREPGHGGRAQAPRDALAVRRAPRQAEARGGGDPALRLRRARGVGRGVPSPHVVANLLGSVLQSGRAPRAALRRPAARALVGRQAPKRQAPPLLGRGRFIVRLRSVAAPASWRRQECARRGAGVARRRIRRRRRRAGRCVRRAPRGDA